ncbi:MAG TPA: heat-inducible transcriptional repressor HrcA [Gammaproteobacteria bacterium]|nr:heat-inducible transcriptional repressor HrcA [Gammaproteobacteria bacterium]
MSETPVNQRARHILKILVERYIQDGQPVGSKTLAEEYALGLSPATIRHILSDLEEAGYLASPYTSAGRVPTSDGYRLFVNHLLTAKPLKDVDIQDLQSQFNPDMALSHLLQSASTVLSSLTQLTGIVALPRRNRIQLRQVEFLPLSSNRVLVILVLNNREVQNRIIYTDRVYSPGELQQAANYLNTHFTGKELLTIRQEMSVALREDRDNMARLLEATMDMASKIFATPDENDKDCLIAGQNNLLHCSPEADFERLRLLFDAISQKQDILNLLDQALEAEGVQIFIGKESGYQAFDDCSIVTQSYSVDGQLVGSLGVIGPRRMPYERVISAVDMTAKLLSAALNQA